MSTLQVIVTLLEINLICTVFLVKRPQFFLKLGKFQAHFSQPLIDFMIGDSYGGHIGHVLPPIKVSKYWVNQELIKERPSEIDPY